MKKLYILITLIAVFFVLYLVTLFIPRDYTINYYVDNYQVTETFNRNLAYYTFLIKYEDKVFPLIYEGRRSRSRRLITRVEKVTDDYFACLSIFIRNTEHPVCYLDSELVSFHLTTGEIRDHFNHLIPEYSNTVINRFGGVQVYNYMESLFFVWNYRGYYLLSDDYNRNITLLDSDDYNNALAFKVNEFLITPNYDRNHNFNELFVINSRNLELSSFTFDDIEISYNAYFQGVVGRYVYLIDRRNRLQYQLNIRRSNIELIGTESRGGKWYNNGWEDASLIRMSNEQMTFVQTRVNNFDLIDGSLYHIINDFKVRISNQEVKVIIYMDNDRVYYLVENVLYMFSNTTGEVRIMSNPEWHFNFQNKIFIFN